MKCSICGDDVSFCDNCEKYFEIDGKVWCNTIGFHYCSQKCTEVVEGTVTE